MLVSPGFTLRYFLMVRTGMCGLQGGSSRRLLITLPAPPPPQEGPGQALLPGDPGPTVGAEEGKDRVGLALRPKWFPQ